VDTAERARREQDRAIRERERLRFRVYAATRDLALGTALFRSHFEFHEPEVVVNVYPRFVDVNVALNEGQLRLLPGADRPRDLKQFAEELREGFGRMAACLHLELTTEPSRFGGAEPIMLLDVSIGYHAVLLRRESE